ncbi:hypothetical protein DFH06DRAFT_1319298 [Mycena polygramma]|nr:hypothetical protein DFH06DRAFT_1319298 [Mycena polygramma]
MPHCLPQQQSTTTLKFYDDWSRGTPWRNTPGCLRHSTPRAARVRLHPQQAAVLLQPLQNPVKACSPYDEAVESESLATDRTSASTAATSSRSDLLLRHANECHTSEKALIASGDGGGGAAGKEE